MAVHHRTALRPAPGGSCRSLRARRISFSCSMTQMSDPKHPPSTETSEEHLGTVHENLEGWIPALASEVEIRAALEKAFDYRGDLTITLKDGQNVVGYVFDRC